MPLETRPYLLLNKNQNVTEPVPAGTTSFEQLHYAGDICFAVFFDCHWKMDQNMFLILKSINMV